LLQQNGQLKEAEKVFLQGIELQPESLNLNYALALFYMTQQQPQKAKPYALVLFELAPNQPDYQRLFQELEIIP
jgi:predicted Zn-dependent protease